MQLFAFLIVNRPLIAHKSAVSRQVRKISVMIGAKCQKIEYGNDARANNFEISG